MNLLPTKDSANGFFAVTIAIIALSLTHKAEITLIFSEAAYPCLLWGLYLMFNYAWYSLIARTDFSYVGNAIRPMSHRDKKVLPQLYTIIILVTLNLPRNTAIKNTPQRSRRNGAFFIIVLNKFFDMI